MGVPQVLFVLGLVFALTPWASPPLALALGLAYGLTFTHPFLGRSQHASRRLLQACVIGLGFGMNLQQVWGAGRSGFVYTAVGITASLALGLALGRLLGVRSREALLISVGTAICGGSAIAAVGPVAGARDEEMTVALGTVFVLNAVGLLLFPVIGAALGLTQTQFGLWAALAIHDTSSVVGATAKYGAVALAVGTTVKLARALWIVPMSLATAAVTRHGAKIQWPWFILFFVLAAVANSYVPAGRHLFGGLAALARVGLTVTLFLIGSHLSRHTLRDVGPRPLVQGVILWSIVSVVTLVLIRGRWIAI